MLAPDEERVNVLKLQNKQNIKIWEYQKRYCNGIEPGICYTVSKTLRFADSTVIRGNPSLNILVYHSLVGVWVR